MLFYGRKPTQSDIIIYVGAVKKEALLLLGIEPITGAPRAMYRAMLKENLPAGAVFGYKRLYGGPFSRVVLFGAGADRIELERAGFEGIGENLIEIINAGWGRVETDKL